MVVTPTQAPSEVSSAQNHSSSSSGPLGLSRTHARFRSLPSHHPFPSACLTCRLLLDVTFSQVREQCRLTTTLTTLPILSPLQISASSLSLGPCSILGAVACASDRRQQCEPRQEYELQQQRTERTASPRHGDCPLHQPHRHLSRSPNRQQLDSTAHYSRPPALIPQTIASSERDSELLPDTPDQTNPRGRLSTPSVIGWDSYVRTRSRASTM